MKQEARAYSVASSPTKATGPLAFGDKCFLCGHQIGESAPRGFYTGKDGTKMMLCHRGCLDALDRVGGDPKELYRLREAKDARVANVPAPPEPETPEPVSVTSPGVSNIKFTDFAHMQQFIAERGEIPAHIGVYVGDQKFQ